jgi:hypothetical protein
MTTIDQQSQAKWDEIDKIAHVKLQNMLDIARQRGYYGRETLSVYSQNGIVTHTERESKTTHKA